MRSFLLLASIAALVACGSSDTGGGSTGDAGVSDGRYHPSPNGVHITEDAACQGLLGAQEDRRQVLGCAGTSRTCPSLLRAEFQTECMEYDQGSLDGCVAYYAEQKSCDDFIAAVGDCVITPYPGTEPQGCP